MGGKELVSLNQLQLAGFRLHPGPLPEQYRSLLNQVQAKEKKKHKKKKHRGSETPAHEEGRTGQCEGGCFEVFTYFFQMRRERRGGKRNTRNMTERVRLCSVP